MKWYASYNSAIGKFLESVGLADELQFAQDSMVSKIVSNLLAQITFVGSTVGDIHTRVPSQ